MESWSPHSRREHESFPHATERVKDTTAIREKIEGGCESWLGQSGRSDPKDGIPVLPIKERANSQNQDNLASAPSDRETD